MLPSEIIRRVREIQVRTGRQVADVLAGEYVSVFRGSGIEFEEVRPYLPGDDIRTIDWNVTARMGEPFVKRYVEERQLTLMLMADISASQEFGSGRRSKREAAAELCALLAFSATRNDDKVGLTLFHDGIEQFIPPRKGQRHALRVVREVLAHGREETLAAREAERLAERRRNARPAALRRRGTSIGGAVEFFLSVTPRRSVCFVVSDFIDSGWERALRTANRKHDVIAVLITDPRELEIPDVGLISLEDAESGRRGLFDSGHRGFRDGYAALARQRIDALRARLTTSGIDMIHIDAAGSVVDPLVRFFRARERRMRR
jgi:uncharacterized protein (DUF58 family)